MIILVQNFSRYRPQNGGEAQPPGEGTSMECATHPGRASVGYCKKCGKFGCEDCMIKVAITGQVGKKLNAAEALLCRECLGKARPDLVIPDSDAEPVVKSGQLGSERVAGIAKRYAAPQEIAGPARSGVGIGKVLTIAAVIGALAAVALAVAIFLPRSKSSPDEGIPPDAVASFGLDALFSGDAEGFLYCVDVPEFMCSMDETGFTRSDYAEADRSKREEMTASHAVFLAKALMVPSNMRREYTVLNVEVGDSSATVRVKPWISYGKRSYRRVVLHKKMGQWRISGLASPDF